MLFRSLHHNAPEVSFKDAVVQGQAPDGGLYFPVEIPQMNPLFFEHLPDLKLHETAYEVLRYYAEDDLGEEALWQICKDVFDFEIPLVEVKDGKYALELFHGPTCAFKDIGARFMARCLLAFAEKGDPINVLVATSGDTGSAVANGFLGQEGVKVTVLYPKGKVSEIQEKQFATLGQNITALAVDGTFDDCQALVKKAFSDETLKGKVRLSSANSINVARWIPQSVYYFHAWGQWRKLHPESEAPVFSVPSGNFGNLAAGILATRMGLPVRQFIAATNINDVVPQYLLKGEYHARPSVATIANAMDVGNPNNFPRVLELYGQNFESLSEQMKGFVATDAEIMDIIGQTYAHHNYLLDPHGAIAYQSLEVLGGDIFLATAAPAKFMDTVKEAIQDEVEMPEQLAKFMDRALLSEDMPNDYEAFKKLLLA